MSDFGLTRLDVYAVGRAYVVQRAKKIDPLIIDVEGSDANLFVGAGSVMVYAAVKQLLYAVNSLLLDGAEDEALDRYALDRYQLPRKGAAAALGTVRLYRDSFAAGAGSVAVGTKLRTLTGAEYVTTTTATFGATDLVSRADVRALQAGKDSQVGANSIRQFSTPASLFDRTLKVNNDSATAGGESRELDADFRNRIRNFWRSARRGILSAIEDAATAVPGVTSAQAIEAIEDGSKPARFVNLFISDSSGVASDALAAKVAVALDDARAAGIYVAISTSIPFLVTVTLKLTFRANVDTNSLTDQIRGAIVEYVNSLPVNSRLTVGGIYSVLQRYVSEGLILDHDTIITPAQDIVPVVGTTLKTTLDQVTAPALAA